VINVI